MIENVSVTPSSQVHKKLPFLQFDTVKTRMNPKLIRNLMEFLSVGSPITLTYHRNLHNRLENRRKR